MDNNTQKKRSTVALKAGLLMAALGLSSALQGVNANTLNTAVATEAPAASESLADYFERCAAYRICNGAVLVAENGKVLLRAAEGYVEAGSDASLSVHHQFDIGSITKQFTAAAIMRLKDQGKIGFDDDIRTYLPELPYEGITVRNLLTHTSGLPEALGYFTQQYRQGLVNAPIMNDQLVTVLATEKLPVRFEPYEKWEYNNTGYFLLATVIERVSGQDYATFLEAEFFAPLGMEQTVSYSPQTEDALEKRAYGIHVGMDQSRRNFDQIPFWYLLGAGGLYSTVDDLYKWDQALTAGKLVSAASWAEATTAVDLADGSSHPYGFGWVLKPSENGSARVAHSGHWRGFKSTFERLEGGRTIIMLTNNGADDSVDQAAVDMEAIMMGRDHKPLKPSITFDLYETAMNEGAEAAKRLYFEGSPVAPRYDVQEDPLNAMGYEFLEEEKTAEAIAVFEIGVAAFPASANAFDSLADAYIAAGRKADARKAAEQALAIDPTFSSSKEKIAALADAK